VVGVIDRADTQGYPWIEIKHGNYNITKKTFELQNSIKDVTEEILKEVIECEKCKKPYRVMENELSFLKRENLPLPTLCFECRQNRRISDRLKLFLYERPCMCNGNIDQTNTYKNTVKHYQYIF